jgi:uncharacterized integral membrane protein
MFRKIATAVILVPLAVIIIGFAVANRQIVSISFDPFDSAHPAYALVLPLFAIVFVLVILGVVIGGIAAWIGQSRWRRAARRLEAEAIELRSENTLLRRQAQSMPSPSARGEDPLLLPPTVP